MPKLMTSASESISRPKSLVVLVMRAMRPSRPSRNTAAPMALAAMAKCSGAPRGAGRGQHRALKRAQNREVAEEDVARGEQRGQRIGRAARPAVRRARVDQPFSKPHVAPPGPARRAITLEPADTRMAGLDYDLPFGPEQHVHARAELDQADALAGGDVVARFLVEHDAAGDQAGDLLEDHARAVALHGDHVLLVLAWSSLRGWRRGTRPPGTSRRRWCRRWGCGSRERRRCSGRC